MTVPPDGYRFGPYEVRTRSRELYKHGTRLKLRPQPFRVLQVLVERAGDVVTRDELRQTLWPAETFVDFEQGLNTSIRELRRILHDSPGQPRYIETLPKLGYRMVAAVEAEPAREAAPAADARPVEEPTSTRPHGQLLRTTRAVWLYAGLAVLLALPVGWIVVNRHPEPETSMPVPLTSFPGHAQAATWSPDGRQVAFKWTGEKQNQFDIYVLQPGSSHALRLTTEAIANINPAWSPDGRWIAYVHIESRSGRSSLELVSPLGGPIRTVLTSETPMGSVSWLPDGRAVVLEIIPGPHQPTALWMVWVETGQHRALTSPPAGIPGDTWPSVAPDGRTVAFCRATFWRTAELYVLDLKPDLSPAAAPRRITDLGFVGSPAWTPDGSRIVFGAYCEGAGLCQIDPSGRHLRPIFGAPPTAGQPALASRPGGYISLVFTNTIAETTIWRYGAEASPGGAPVELAPSSHSQGGPRYSGDGKRLAFGSDRSGYDEIWVANADGSQPVRLTDLRHVLTETPEWSPSSEQIAFVSQERANRQIYMVRASGGPALAITNEEGITSGDGWAQDGSTYYYTSTRSGRREVWKVARSGGRPQQITFGGGQCGFESPGGVFYYWKGDSAKRGTLMRRMPAGDQPVSLTPPGIACRISPSPKGFYFKAADASGVYFYDEASDRCVRVPQRPDRPFDRFTVSPDANWLAINVDGTKGSDLMIMEHFR